MLGHPEDRASIRFTAVRLPCAVGSLSSGEFVSSAPVGGGEILVYDPSGKVVRTIGRSSEGPGELGTSLTVIVGTADTLFVVDRSRRQVVTFDPAGADQTDSPLVRVLDAAGSEVAALERPSRQMLERGMGSVDFRLVSPAVFAAYWTARYWSYELQRWGGPGDRELTIVRDVEWFPPSEPASYDEINEWSEEGPPYRHLIHMRETADGLLWTHSAIPDENWEVFPGRDGPEITRRGWDTVVEVLDMENGASLATLRHDEYLAPVCDSDLVSILRETPEGDMRAAVFRVGLRR